MVKKYACSFCGTDIEPGSGSVFVKNDGSLLYLCSSKCRRSQLILKRRARRLKWTEVYEERLRRRAHAAKTKAKRGSTKKEKVKEEKTARVEKEAPVSKPKAKKAKTKTKSKPKAKDSKKTEKESKAKE